MSIFLSPNSNIICREILQKPPQHQLKSYGFILNIDWGRRKFGWKTRSKRDVKANSASSLDFSRPDALEMQPIVDCDHLDNILSEAQLLSQPIIIDWMASWCRKCIYLKPKLEKLAAEYDTKLKIFYVDVNNVSQELVKRGNISKMPTIQLWKDGEMKEEVIGGQKGWIVIEEIKEMIHKYINDADVLNSM